jgi:hypothetical protein
MKLVTGVGIGTQSGTAESLNVVPAHGRAPLRLPHRRPHHHQGVGRGRRARP